MYRIRTLVVATCLLVASTLSIGPGLDTEAAASSQKWWLIWDNGSCKNNWMGMALVHPAALALWQVPKTPSYKGYNVHGCQPHPYQPLP